MNNRFFLSKFFNKLVKNRKKISNWVVEKIQLTATYYFSIAIFVFLIKDIYPDFPESFYSYLPYMKQVITSRFFTYLNSSDKMYFVYLVVLEIFINRPIFDTSLLVKFNIFLLVVFEMCHQIIIGFWDLLWNRKVEGTNYLFFDNLVDIDSLISNLNFTFFSVFFYLFILLYFYFYIRALFGLFPSFPYFPFLDKMIDSVAYWLNLIKEEQESKEN